MDNSLQLYGVKFVNFKIGKTNAAFHKKNFEIKNLSLPIEYGCNQTLSKMVQITLGGGGGGAVLFP